MPPPTPITAGKFKSFRLLLNKKHRLESGTCLIEGRRFVAEALDRPGTIDCLLCTPRFAGTPEGAEFLRDAGRRNAAVHTITEKQLGQLSDTVSSQGVLAVIRLPGVGPQDILRLRGERLLLVALDGVTDPGNLGAIIRTCAWFGADAVLISERSVELSNPKLLRSTMGAVFHVPVAAGISLPEMIPDLRKKGFRILAAEAGGEPAGAVLPCGGNVLLVFGSEARGLSPIVRDLADVKFGIAGSGRIESLNVSVAVGIALFMATSGTRNAR
ncbi:MAG TPA: RNA methyltransferase [Bacteroidota bacterium]|nr:RNA methyltransferase [Bacteroidota bacterium]